MNIRPISKAKFKNMVSLGIIEYSENTNRYTYRDYLGLFYPSKIKCLGDTLHSVRRSGSYYPSSAGNIAHWAVEEEIYEN